MNRRLAVLALLGGAFAPVLPAQEAERDSMSPPAIRPSSHWHSALEAHQALRGPQPTAEDVVRAVGAELTIGRPERARLVLGSHRIADPVLESELARLDAAVAYASGRYEEAGTLFAAAARRSAGAVRGTLAARAGDAFEKAGNRAAAAEQYREARNFLEDIEGWLALREARVIEDTASAFPLLDRVPASSRRFVPMVRGELLAAAGDTARAVAVLAAASLDGRAARLALAAGDSVGARQLAYRAIRAGDTAVANVGIELAQTIFPPQQPAEFLSLARAVRRTAPRQASVLVARAAGADPAPATLLLWGDLLSDLRKYDSALVVYGRVAAGSGSESATAQFSRARTLIRLGRPLGAARALTEFVAAHSTHPSAPMAAFLQADLAQEARRADADSLFRSVIRRWPRHDYATMARLRLAGTALNRGDTASAAEWYRDEADARGGQQFAARFFLAALAEARGDTVAAREEWTQLAQRDSLGYYGGLARGRAGLPSPVVAAAESRERSQDLRRALEQLDLLDQVAFDAEAGALVSWLVARDANAEETLDLAEALVERGRTTQAIQLGWRATRSLTLHHPRVLRAIYPWPLRDVVHAEAREFDLDPYLLAALIRQESSFDPAALSRAGARGLMQVMPATARQAARRMGLDWSDQLLRVPDANIHVGAAHLASLLRHYRGEVVPSLAAYNAGLTPVERWRRRFPEAGDPARFVERIPYAETRGYVRSVLRNWEIYRALYPATDGS